MSDVVATLETTTGEYGVSVGQVLALIPYVPVTESETPMPAVHPYGLGAVTERTITIPEVVGFIESVSSRVRGHTAAGDRFAEGHWIKAYLAEAGADAVKNGAASYTLAAVSPEGTPGATSLSYSDVLWQRFLESLREIDAAIDRAKDDPIPPGPGGSGGARISTRPARFPDGLRL